LLLVATVIIVYQALQRFGAPVQSHGATMTVVAAFGLVVNLSIAWMLSRGASAHKHVHAHAAHDHVRSGDLNVQAALFHVVGDALGAFAVIVGGIVVSLTGSTWIDPALSLFVAAVIVVGVWRVMRDATNVLLEATPRNIDARQVEERIAALDGVVAVHDLHVWSIGSGSAAISAHVLLDDRRLSEASSVLSTLRAMVEEQYDITHVTVQFECEHCDPQGAIICVPAAPPKGA
jgi:cobalt-zinc-cadmium efflux system protein